MATNPDYRSVIIDTIASNEGIQSLEPLYRAVRLASEDGSCDRDAVDAVLAKMLERGELTLTELADGPISKGGVLKIYETPTLDDYDYDENYDR